MGSAGFGHRRPAKRQARPPAPVPTERIFSISAETPRDQCSTLCPAIPQNGFLTGVVWNRRACVRRREAVLDN